MGSKQDNSKGIMISQNKGVGYNLMTVVFSKFKIKKNIYKARRFNSK